MMSTNLLSVHLGTIEVKTAGATPRPTWNPDIPQPIHFYDSWQRMPNTLDYENAFKIQWELFIRHVAEDGPFPWNIASAVAGVQLAEAGKRSSQERRWVSLANASDVPAKRAD